MIERIFILNVIGVLIKTFIKEVNVQWYEYLALIAWKMIKHSYTFLIIAKIG